MLIFLADFLISTPKLNGLHLQAEAHQVLAFPGTTLTELENALKPLQAEYIHRQAFDLTIRYAQHVYKAIGKQGPEKIPEMFAPFRFCRTTLSTA